eukprot:m.54290 g.54290  ORF g.54290 m.54290 type:complete len:911 (+) comp9189_c0_seq1:3497-6229(+)
MRPSGPLHPRPHRPRGSGDVREGYRGPVLAQRGRCRLCRRNGAHGQGGNGNEPHRVHSVMHQLSAFVFSCTKKSRRRTGWGMTSKLGRLGCIVGILGWGIGAVHASAAGSRTQTGQCPPGYVTHATGFWNNTFPDFRTDPSGVDRVNNTLPLCAAKCSGWGVGGGSTEGVPRCVGFHLYADGVTTDSACYIYLGTVTPPFTPLPPPTVTCLAANFTPPVPPPPPTPPQRGRTTGHPFPRVGTCWGPDPWITEAMWNYVGFPNITNASWGHADVLYINPFDSCCYQKQMSSWAPLIKAIKAANPAAIILATFHATEIWADDLTAGNRWLPDSCLMRNVGGSPCSWWVDLVFTNNLFRPECMQAAVTNALTPLPDLIAAGVDGVFLDGVVPYNLGCTNPDVNCTAAGCPATPNPPDPAALEQEWVGLYATWFAQLKATHPSLLWVNNMVDTLQPGLLKLSNGRQYEGGDGLGLNSAYTGALAISARIAETRLWSTEALQPSYILTGINSAIEGPWRVGRWQNLVTAGEMLRLLTDFRRMRFGLGVTLMTNGYFSFDLGGGWYGQPSRYTEYAAPLGQAVADPVLLFAAPAGGGEVWSREFDGGYVVVSSLAVSNFTVDLPANLRGKLRLLPLAANPAVLTDQREAPMWQLMIDNDLATEESGRFAPRNTLTPDRTEASPSPHSGTDAVGGWGWPIPTRPQRAPRQPPCECSAAAPACCPHGQGKPADWWADPGRRAGMRVVAGNWTTVSDLGQSHQVGDSFLVSFVEPGPQPQGEPPAFEVAYHFVAPSTDAFNLGLTSVDPHLYSPTDGAIVCLRPYLGPTGAVAPCLAHGTVDQRVGYRDGRWVRALSLVPLVFNQSYELVVTWDPARGGYAVADAVLVESATFYHQAPGVLTQTQAVVGAMDSRVFLKK